MWAVIGVWELDAEVLEEFRSQVPLMASSKVGTPGFLHGTWTLDGHAIQVFADETNARSYHQRMIDGNYLERPGLRNLVWDVTEVGAESNTAGWTDRQGDHHSADEVPQT